MGDDASPVFDATGKVVVLAFDLAGSQIANMPNELAAALKKPEVESAIQGVLATFALSKQASGTSVVSDKDAQKLVSDFVNKASDKVTDALLDQLKKTAEYKRLDQSLTDLEKVLKTTGVGAWVDKEKNILYVVGAGLAVAGAAALWVTRTGGLPVSLPIGRLTGKPIQVFKVGNFTLSGKLLSFKPDIHELGASIVGSQKWGKLPISVELGVVATGKQATTVGQSVVLQTNPISIGSPVAIDPTKNTVQLGITFGITNGGKQGPITIGVSGMLQDNRLTGGQVVADFQFKGGTKLGAEASVGPTGKAGMLILSKSF